MPELEPPQLQAAILIAQGLSTREVGEKVGVSLRTIQRWQKLDLFIETVQSLSQKVRQETVEKTANEFIEENLVWAERRQLLRYQEWEVSQALIKKAQESIKELEISGRIQNIANALKIASEIGRKSSELWSGDLNAAIELVRKFGYDVVDQQGMNDDSEIEGTDY